MTNFFSNILKQASKLDFPAMLDEVEQLQLLQDALLVYFIYKHLIFLFMYRITTRQGALDIEFFPRTKCYMC